MCIPHRIYGIHLGMRLTVTPMISLSYNSPTMYDDRTHHRIGRHVSSTQRSQLQTTSHENGIHICFIHIPIFLIKARFDRCSFSARNIYSQKSKQFLNFAWIYKYRPTHATKYRFVTAQTGSNLPSRRNHRIHPNDFRIPVIRFYPRIYTVKSNV